MFGLKFMLLQTSFVLFWIISFGMPTLTIETTDGEHMFILQGWFNDKSITAIIKLPED